MADCTNDGWGGCSKCTKEFGMDENLKQSGLYSWDCALLFQSCSRCSELTKPKESLINLQEFVRGYEE